MKLIIILFSFFIMRQSKAQFESGGGINLHFSNYWDGKDKKEKFGPSAFSIQFNGAYKYKWIYINSSALIGSNIAFKLEGGVNIYEFQLLAGGLMEANLIPIKPVSAHPKLYASYTLRKQINRIYVQISASRNAGYAGIGFSL